MKNNLLSKIKNIFIRIVFIFAILIFIGGITFLYSQIGDADTFDNINVPTEENTEYIQKANASEVFKILDENLTFFDKLYRKVKATDDVDVLVNELEEGFKKLATSFRELANNNDEIEREFRKRITLLSEYGTQAISVKERLEVEISSLRSEKTALMKKIETMQADSLEMKKAKILLSTLETKITTHRTRKNIWENYVITHSELRSKLGDLSENISLFLYALEQTAEVYEEAYETLKIASQASQAIASLQELANIDTYSESLLSTFNQVDEIMLKLNSLDFQN